MNINSNGEKINQDNLKNKKTPVSIELKFKKDFVFESLKSKNQTNKNIFINEIMTNSLITGTSIETEIKEFLAKNQDEYQEIDISKIDIYQLRNLVAKDFLRQENAKNELKEKIFLDYEISDEIYEKNIKKTLLGLSDYNLKDLSVSDKKLTDYLKNVCDLELNKRDKFKVLTLIDSKETQKRLNNIDQDYRGDIEELLEKITLKGELTDTDLKLMFSTNFLKNDEKKELVNIFIPFISLQKAVNIGLMTESEAQAKLKQINKKILTEANIQSSNIDSISSSLSLSDIRISTKDYDSVENLDDIAQEVGFVNLERDLIANNEETKRAIKESGPQNLNQLIEALQELDKTGTNFTNLQKFNEGNILEFSITASDGEEEKSYIRIVENKENEKKFSYMSIGTYDGAINLTNTGNIQNIDYVDFLSKFHKNNIKLNCFTSNEIKEKIDSGELKKTGIDLLVPDDLNHNFEKKENTKLKNKASLEKQIENIKKDIEEIKEKTSKNDINVLEKLLTQKESQLNNLDNYSNKLLVQEHNYNELIEKIDELDIEGINISCNGERGLFKGMFLNTKEKGLFEVNGIEKDIGKITLITLNDKGNYEPQTYDYFQFYEAFKDNETKRLKNISDFGELIDIKSTDNDNWKNHKIDNGKLMATNVVDGSEKKDMEVNYLVSDESDTIVRINEFSGNHVKIQFGERKENKNLTDKEKKGLKFQKDDKGNVIGETLLIKGAQEYSISLNQLDLLIKEYKFYPNWQTGKTEKEKVLEPETEFGTSFFSKLFSLSSVSEVLAGGKMVIDSIGESLKKGNDLHSAKAALVMGGAFLPEELKQELQIKVERAESESMDKELESLGKVDSRIAVKRIEKWLLNKDTPEYKKEAGILFMLEKYGHLTSKGALYPHRGKFLWYEAFGGSVGDDFFNRIKKESFDQDITFSEEFLMLILLKQQCKGNFLGHRRRSRLHKEFDAKWSRGISEEVEKGYKDASLKRNARTMVDEGLDAEVAGGTTSNGIGWFKKAIERGGSLEDMSEGFFCMLYSGVLFDVDQKTFMNIKALWDGGMPIIMTRYSTKLSDMKLFNKTVLELSLRMGDIYGNKMGEEAQKLFTATENKTGNEEDRVKDAQKFWKKYGTPLSRALNFANTKDNTYSKTDNIIFLEKENNDTFAEYYKSTKGFVSEITFDKDLMDDACGEVGITGLNVIGLTKKYLKIGNHRQLTEPKTGARVWKEIIKDMKSVRTKDISEIDKKRYLLNTLKDLTSGFLSNLAGGNLEIYNYPSTNIGKALNKMKLFIGKDLGGFSPDGILDGEADRVLGKVVNNILAGALEGGDSDIYVNPLEEISAPIKKEANNILEQDSGMFGETI